MCVESCLYVKVTYTNTYIFTHMHMHMHTAAMLLLYVGYVRALQQTNSTKHTAINELGFTASCMLCAVHWLCCSSNDEPHYHPTHIMCRQGAENQGQEAPPSVKSTYNDVPIGQSKEPGPSSITRHKPTHMIQRQDMAV
jgi:hypothetical protein